MPQEVLLMQGKAEKRDRNHTFFSIRTSNREIGFLNKGFSYQTSLDVIINAMIDPENECISSLHEVDVVGHRLIHGGETGTACVEITRSLVETMKNSVSLAPLHYPANLEGIKATNELMPGVFQAGVFDTAFHHTLPKKAFLYGIPFEWYQKYQIRRYGFHGTSHWYAVQKACEISGLPYLKSRIVSCHLGNGASVAAIKNGESTDTSMGMTPAEGLLMGTRCGDIDAGVLVYLMQHFNLSDTDLQQMINDEGGLLGLSGVSPDYRKVEKAATEGHEKARTALKVYHYRIKKYIGAYAAAMGGIDGIVFTGGVGENSIKTRQKVCKEMEFLGIRLSKNRNRSLNGREAMVHKKKSKVKIIIVPANEELLIAREVASLAKKELETGR